MPGARHGCSSPFGPSGPSFALMSFFGVPEVESKTHAVRMGESSAIVALPCATHGVSGRRERPVGGAERWAHRDEGPVGILRARATGPAQCALS